MFVTRSTKDVSYTAMQIAAVLQEMVRPEDEGLFHDDIADVHPELLADYQRVCPRRTCLKVMIEEARKGAYNAGGGGGGLQKLHDDIDLMCNNCLKFNRDAVSPWFTERATSFRPFAHGLVRKFRVEHNIMDISSSSSTATSGMVGTRSGAKGGAKGGGSAAAKASSSKGAGKSKGGSGGKAKSSSSQLASSVVVQPPASAGTTGSGMQPAKKKLRWDPSVSDSAGGGGASPSASSSAAAAKQQTAKAAAQCRQQHAHEIPLVVPDILRRRLLADHLEHAKPATTTTRNIASSSSCFGCDNGNTVRSFLGRYLGLVSSTLASSSDASEETGGVVGVSRRAVVEQQHVAIVDIIATHFDDVFVACLLYPSERCEAYEYAARYLLTTTCSSAAGVAGRKANGASTTTPSQGTRTATTTAKGNTTGSSIASSSSSSGAAAAARQVPWSDVAPPVFLLRFLVLFPQLGMLAAMGADPSSSSSTTTASSDGTGDGGGDWVSANPERQLVRGVMPVVESMLCVMGRNATELGLV